MMPEASTIVDEETPSPRASPITTTTSATARTGTRGSADVRAAVGIVNDEAARNELARSAARQLAGTRALPMLQPRPTGALPSLALPLAMLASTSASYSSEMETGSAIRMSSQPDAEPVAVLTAEQSSSVATDRSGTASTTTITAIPPTVPMKRPTKSDDPRPVTTRDRPQPRPRTLKKCTMPLCESNSRSRGLCKAHGGGKRCMQPGCTLSDQGGGMCIRHGGGRRCEMEGCTKSAQSRRFCKAHGGGLRCKAPGCVKTCQAGGLCRTHGGGPRKSSKRRQVGINPEALAVLTEIPTFASLFASSAWSASCSSSSLPVTVTTTATETTTATAAASPLILTVPSQSNTVVLRPETGGDATAKATTTRQDILLTPMPIACEKSGGSSLAFTIKAVPPARPTPPSAFTPVAGEESQDVRPPTGLLLQAQHPQQGVSLTPSHDSPSVRGHQQCRVFSCCNDVASLDRPVCDQHHPHLFAAASLLGMQNSNATTNNQSSAS